jgi:hypothetical protein
MAKQLAIVNEYGNVDVRAGLSKVYQHVRGKNLQPLCRKLGIRFAPAVVDFAGSGRRCECPLDLRLLDNCCSIICCTRAGYPNFTGTS